MINTIVIQKELLTDEVKEEMIPLIGDHFEEIAHYKDILPDPDWEKYDAIQDTGGLYLMTVRDHGMLVGYIAYFVGINLHYKSSLCAVQDVIFLDTEYRHGMLGAKLISKSHEMLKEAGVQVVSQHVKKAHDFSPMLERMGYEEVDIIMCKRID
jgi:hypothetical protein